MTIPKSDDKLVVAAVVATTCRELKEMLSEFLGVPEHQIRLTNKVGKYHKTLLDHVQPSSEVFVHGVKALKPAKQKWPHPVGIIGCGYYGLKVAMTYVLDGDDNFVMFDRHDKFGGYCWLNGANKTSRLQTELGSFHVWWGQNCVNSGRIDYPDCNRQMNWMCTKENSHDPEKTGWSVYPYKWEILHHFNTAAEKFGILPHCKFKSNVVNMEIIGAKNSEDRYYKLLWDRLDAKNKASLADKDGKLTDETNVSIIYHFPGALTQNRIVYYPGEEDFKGAIGYGMGDDTPYDQLANSNIAILGNGAFAVENARTSLECGGLKAYIICRRKNLASPRLACWFVQQAPLPVPAALLLQAFEPMYKLTGWEDPWSFWSVHSDSARKNVTIIQNSRFGIADVTFLMVAWGLLEYKIAVVKRFSRNTVHLSTGEALEDIHIVLKALGLTGDFAVDKLHNMKELKGRFCAGDWRRFISNDGTGLNANNFITFSIGPVATDTAISMKFLYDYPKEFYKMEQLGFMDVLPKTSAKPDLEKPAYVTDPKTDFSAVTALNAMCPKLALMVSWVGAYKHKMYHLSHGTDRILEVAMYEWDKYQEEWKNRGIEHDYVPYPYTKDMVQSWFDSHSAHWKMPVAMSADGPTDELLEYLGGDVGSAKQWGPSTAD